MKITRYRINTIFEESPCDFCGMPLYVDDYARECNGRVYCSANCAEQHADANPEIITPDAEPITAAREAAQDARAESQMALPIAADGIAIRTRPGGQVSF